VESQYRESRAERAKRDGEKEKGRRDGCAC